MPPFTSPLPPTSAPQGMAPPATDPRRSRSDEILDGAAELFAEYGYHGSSLRDISHQVGISHPGMLHHFASKDALLGGVIDRLEAHAQAALDRRSEEHTSELQSRGHLVCRLLLEKKNNGQGVPWNAGEL